MNEKKDCGCQRMCVEQADELYFLSEGSLVTDSVEEGDLQDMSVFRRIGRGKLRPTLGVKNGRKVEVESQFDSKNEKKEEGRRKEEDEKRAQTGNQRESNT